MSGSWTAAHRPRLGYDLENGAHKYVSDEGNAQEAVEHTGEVEASPRSF